MLCGVNEYGEGTYTTEGITKLCEGLKGSAVTSLKFAADPRSVCFRVTPLTHASFSLTPPPPCLQFESH